MNREHIEINNQIIKLFFDLSEKVILNIEINLFNTLDKMIEGKFISNVLINLCNLNYNDIYKYMVTKSTNDTVIEFLHIQKLFSHDLLCILKISFGITIEIIKNLNRTQYNFLSQNKFIESIQNQFELIKNINYGYFVNLIENHNCDDSINTSDPNKRYFC